MRRRSQSIWTGIAPSAVTERLNQVYSQEDSAMDPALQRAALKTLAKDRW